MNEKPVSWLGSSRADVRAFPKAARERVGRALHMVQRGFEPPDWKPMSSVGLGVREIRVRAGRQFRLVYVAKHEEAVYVLHAFEKKSGRTSTSDLSVARQRFALMRRLRGEDDR